jgi:hypothetical protein
MGYGRLWVLRRRFGVKSGFGSGPNLWDWGLYELREVWVMSGPTVYLNDTSNYGVSHPITSIRILMPRLVIMLTPVLAE